MAQNEVKYYGLHTCLAIWQKRKESIIRVYLERSRLKECGPLLKWCAETKKAYHIVDAEDLQKLTSSVHHEGVCILAKERPLVSLEQLLASLPPPPVCLVYLDGVQNPHNIGSILRSCAHFGVPFLLAEAQLLPRLAPATCRIAQGGAELVGVAALQQPKKAIHLLQKQGFQLIAASHQKGKEIYKQKFADRVIFAFGSEDQGLSRWIEESADARVFIPGSGQIDSLNVAVASAICLAECWRQSHYSPLSQ